MKENNEINKKRFKFCEINYYKIVEKEHNIKWYPNFNDDEYGNKRVFTGDDRDVCHCLMTPRNNILYSQKMECSPLREIRAIQMVNFMKGLLLHF